MINRRGIILTTLLLFIPPLFFAVLLFAPFLQRPKRRPVPAEARLAREAAWYAQAHDRTPRSYEMQPGPPQL